MTNKSWALAAFLMLSPLAVADSVTITTSTTCITNGGSVLDPASCISTGVPNGSALADASASYSISGNTLTITLTDDADVAETIIPGALTGASNSASAQSSILINIVTAGLVRPGIVIQTGAGGAAGSEGNGSGGGATANFFGLGGEGYMCTYPRGCDGSYPSGYPLPITLGPGLGVYATASAEADVATLNFGVNGAGGHGNVGETFEFFEADGVTPVDIALATPEPASIALVALASLGFGLSIAAKRLRHSIHI